MKTKALYYLQLRSVEWVLALSMATAMTYMSLAMVSQSLVEYMSASLFPAYLTVLGL